ncbi:MAG: hypothetical protein ACRDH8_12960 [Actinomycetota bacterium]
MSQSERNRPAVPAGILTEKTELRIRKLADTTKGTRVKKYDPTTGQSELINPATGEAEPWPLLGVTVEAAPDVHEFPMRWVLAAEREGWLELKGRKVVVVAESPDGATHTVPGTGMPAPYAFVEATEIVIKAVEGSIRYKVTRNPGQHLTPIHPAEESEVKTQYRIDWFYIGELIGG